MSWSASGTLYSADNGAGTNTSSLSVNPGAAGNLCIIEATVYNPTNTAAPTSISGGGITWTVVATYHSTARNVYVAVFAGQATSSASFIATIGYSGTLPATGINVRIAGQSFSCTNQGWTYGPVLHIDSAGQNTWAALIQSGTFLYFGYAYNQGTAVNGSTSGFVYQQDNHTNSLAYNLAASSGAQPTFGDSTQSVGIMVPVIENAAPALPTPSGPAITTRPRGTGIITSNGLFRFLQLATPSVGTPHAVTSMGTYGVVNAGDACIVSVIHPSTYGSAQIALSDSSGNTYTYLGVENDATSGFGVSYFVACNVKALTSVSTQYVTVASTVAYIGVYSISVSGLGRNCTGVTGINTGTGSPMTSTPPVGVKGAVTIVNACSTTGGGTSFTGGGFTNPQGYVNVSAGFMVTGVAPAQGYALSTSITTASTAPWMVSSVTITGISQSFPDTELGSRAELQLRNGTWIDVTSRMFDSDSGVITRGTQDESTTFNPSQFTGTFDNSDGALASLNPLSPYYGQLGLNTPLRISVPHGSTYLDLTQDVTPGQGPQSGVQVAGLNGWNLATYGIDIQVDVDMVNLMQGSGAVLAAKISGTGVVEWSFGVIPTTQAPYLSSRSGGVDVRAGWQLVFQTATSLDVAYQTYPLNTHGRISLRYLWNPSTNARDFYVGTNLGSWFNVGQLSNGTPTNPNPSAPVYFFGYPGNRGVSGKAYGFALYEAGNAASSAGMDFTTGQTVGATSWMDGSGNAVTAFGTAAINDRNYRFWGGVASWPQTWTPGGTDARVALTAAGPMRRMGETNVATRSSMYRAYTLEGAGGAPVVSYWPFESSASFGSNPSAATVFAPVASLPNTPAVVFKRGGLDVGANTDFLCSEPLPQLNGQTVVFQLPSYPQPSGPGSSFAMRLLVSVPSGGDTVNGTVAEIYTTGSIKKFMMTINTSNNTFQLQTFAAPGSASSNPFAPTITWNLDFMSLPCRLSLEMFQDTATTFHADLGIMSQDGTQAYSAPVTVNGSTTGSTVLTGTIGTMTGGGINTGAAALIGTAFGHVSFESSATSLFNLFGALTAWEGEGAGERFQRLCMEEGISHRQIGNAGITYPIGAIDAVVDLGDTAAMGPQTVETIAELLQECADADNLVMYESRDTPGFGITTRVSMGNQNAAVALDYNTDVLMGDLQPTIDDQYFKNDVTAISNTSGSAARAILSDGSVASVTSAGTYDTQVNVNTAADSQLADIAGWELYYLSANEPRYTQIAVDLANRYVSQQNPSLYYALMDAEIGDKITIAHPPVWVPPGSIAQVIKGVTETIGMRTFNVAYNTVPSKPYDAGYSDDATFGVVDTSGTTLQAAVTSTATSVNVVSVDPNGWTGTGVPFNISMGGETCTVTAVTSVGSGVYTFTVTRSVNGVVKAQAAGTDVRLQTPSITSY